MLDTLWIANSKFGKLIRLTGKVWYNKISIEHPEFSNNPEYLEELEKAIEDPEYVIEGWQGECLALRWCEIAPKTPKYLCVVYREHEIDGFVITAFFISRFDRLLRRNIKWHR